MRGGVPSGLRSGGGRGGGRGARGSGGGHPKWRRRSRYSRAAKGGGAGAAPLRRGGSRAAGLGGGSAPGAPRRTQRASGERTRPEERGPAPVVASAILTRLANERDSAVGTSLERPKAGGEGEESGRGGRDADASHYGALLCAFVRRPQGRFRRAQYSSVAMRIYERRRPAQVPRTFAHTAIAHPNRKRKPVNNYRFVSEYSNVSRTFLNVVVFFFRRFILFDNFSTFFSFDRNEKNYGSKPRLCRRTEKIFETGRRK